MKRSTHEVAKVSLSPARAAVAPLDSDPRLDGLRLVQLDSRGAPGDDRLVGIARRTRLFGGAGGAVGARDGRLSCLGWPGRAGGRVSLRGGTCGACTPERDRQPLSDTRGRGAAARV